MHLVSNAALRTADSCFEDDSDAIQHDVATLRGGERATTPLAVDAELWLLSEAAKSPAAASAAACLASQRWYQTST